MHLYEDDIRVEALIDIAKALEGLPRHSSTHAAGVVIASKPLVNYVPLQKNEEMIVTQFPMGTLRGTWSFKNGFSRTSNTYSYERLCRFHKRK